MAGALLLGWADFRYESTVFYSCQIDTQSINIHKRFILLLPKFPSSRRAKCVTCSTYVCVSTVTNPCAKIAQTSSEAPLRENPFESSGLTDNGAWLWHPPLPNGFPNNMGKLHVRSRSGITPDSAFHMPTQQKLS